MQMTGIQFMDNLRAPRKSVRSTKMSSIRPLENISLSEQAMAVLLELPQLMLYSRVGQELQEWITQNSEVYSKMEEEALEATPELFIEYARAEEDEQADLRVSPHYPFSAPCLNMVFIAIIGHIPFQCATTVSRSVVRLETSVAHWDTCNSTRSSTRI